MRHNAPHSAMHLETQPLRRILKVFGPIRTTPPQKKNVLDPENDERVRQLNARIQQEQDPLKLAQLVNELMRLPEEQPSHQSRPNPETP